MKVNKDNIIISDYGTKHMLRSMYVITNENSGTKNTAGYLFYKDSKTRDYVEEIITTHNKTCKDIMNSMIKDTKSEYKFFNIPYLSLVYETEFNTIILDDTKIKFNFVRNIILVGKYADITYKIVNK